MNYKKGIADCYNNIGTIYKSQSNFSKALEYYRKSLEINKLTGDKNGESINYNNIGIIYSEQGNRPEEALEYFKKSLKISEELNDEQGMSVNYTNISCLNKDMKNYRQALEYGYKALSITKKLGTLDTKQLVYLDLSDIHDSLGNIKDAFKYYKLYSETKDSILNKESHNKIAEMEVKYETEKKEKEIEIQALKISEQNLKLDSNRMWTAIFVICFLLIIAFGLITFSNYRIKQQERLKTEMLRQQKLRTNAIITTQEEERKRIAQDLHDSLGHKLTAVKINFEKIKGNTVENMPEMKTIFEQTSNILDETHKELRSISHQMMPKALQEKELAYAISELVEQTLANSDIKYKLTNNIPNDISENIGIGLYRVLQELLNNTLKHAKASVIAVQIFKNKDVLIMIVEDDGIGIKKNDTKEWGIGLKNIAGRVNALNGIFLIETGPVKGTVATVRIPIIIQKT
ncbi:MAG: tetratricopeptide repeat protein [Bacteroidetes bacterium]|nr:tetratricopeptide repeat protein [Bacteroidota bacterium]